MNDIKLNHANIDEAADALTQAGHRVELRDPDAGLLPYLAERRPDVVFPALHGSSGEDGSLLELLAALGVPTVGSTGAAARRAWSKPVASSLVAQAGLAVPAEQEDEVERFREFLDHVSPDDFESH